MSSRFIVLATAFLTIASLTSAAPVVAAKAAAKTSPRPAVQRVAVAAGKSITIRLKGKKKATAAGTKAGTGAAGSKVVNNAASPASAVKGKNAKVAAPVAGAKKAKTSPNTKAKVASKAKTAAVKAKTAVKKTALKTKTAVKPKAKVAARSEVEAEVVVE